MLRSRYASLLLPLVLAVPAFAQSDFKTQPAPPPTPPPQGEKGGPARGRVTERVAIGEKAPDFELISSDGKTVRLSKMRGDWVMLVFVQRRDSLRAVEPMARKLSEIRVRTLAVCFDKQQALAQLLRGRDIGYSALADPTGDIIALYGLLEPLRDQGQPGFVLVNPIGDVRLALLGMEMPREDAARLVQFAVTGE